MGRSGLILFTAVGLGCGGAVGVEQLPVAQPPVIGPITWRPEPRPTGAVDAGAREEAAPVEVRTWYLSIDREHATLVLPPKRGSEGQLFFEGQGSPEAVDQVRGPAGGSLSFRSRFHGSTAWFRGRVEGGVFAGRWATSEQLPDALDDFPWHVTGWNQAVFDASPSRVFRLELALGDLVTLRVDGPFADRPQSIGRWKRFGSRAAGRGDEGDEYELAVSAWDGTQLAFGIVGDREGRSCHADVQGERIRGSCVSAEGFVEPFRGVRTEVMTYGLTPKPTDQRAAWQEATRRALELLTQGGAGVPSAVRVEPAPISLPPLQPQACLPQRDDAMDLYPADYTRQELWLRAEYPSPDGRPGHERTIHGWLLMPNAPPPAGGFPAIVTLNGHSGSALLMTDPDSEFFWYGDSFARRGFVVFAVDVSHRPLRQRWSLYTDYQGGDAELHGNGPHPAITFDGLDSDWEEDGERAADASNAREFLARQAFVDASKVGVVGLSMGGAVATLAGALDPSFAFVISAGSSPDVEVLGISGNHPCFRWQHADQPDYLSTADLHALIAPRHLVIETGAVDQVYSLAQPPFSQDLQVVRRSRVAFMPEQQRLAHYLHGDEHHFRAASTAACGLAQPGLTVPVLTGPTPTTLVSWQVSAATWIIASDLFEWLSATP